MNFLELTEAERQALAEEGALMNSAESVRYIVVHCSATRENQDYPVSQLESDHHKRGFRKIGYHFYIRKDGTVTQHRYLLEVGAHCRPHTLLDWGLLRGRAEYGGRTGGYSHVCAASAVAGFDPDTEADVSPGHRDGASGYAGSESV